MENKKIIKNNLKYKINNPHHFKVIWFFKTFKIHKKLKQITDMRVKLLLKDNQDKLNHFKILDQKKILFHKFLILLY
jgi:hypothetical protein